MKGVIINMKMLIILAMVFFLPRVSAENQSDKTMQKHNTHVLIVSGINKDPQEEQAKEQAVKKLARALVKDIKLDPKQVYLLADSEAFVASSSGRSTAENLKKVVDFLAKTVKPSDRFIFYYIGQANIVAGKLRFNLPGPDITHEELAKLIKGIAASTTVVVLDCPGAGLAIKSLTGKDRIVICAARSDQPYSTQFSWYFGPALADPASDVDGDGRVSLLEAFRRAAEQLDELYRSRDLLKTEIPLLEDDGDGIPSQQPWRYKEKKKDGRAASQFFFE